MAEPREPLVVLLPVWNDWEALEALLERLETALAVAALEAQVVVLDDASTSPWQKLDDADLPANKNTAIKGLRVVSLRRNLGHQRAIAIGLAHVHESFPGATTVVMDADGEDDPADVPRLVEVCRRNGLQQVVFAERTRRLESWWFQASYQLYRFTHRLLTGIAVKVGNFSVVPWECLEQLVVVSELWSHYAAAVFRARIPYLAVPTARARRLAGRSKMRFVSLVAHGLTAISVFGEVVGVRLLIAMLGFLLVLLLGLGTAVIAGVATPLAVPLWAALAASFVLVVLLQTLALAVVFVFVVLGGRQATAFIPLRDHRFFIRATHDL